MSSRGELRLPFEDDTLESRLDARDREGRARAVDPRCNVALEASAGTGKTRVLVDRYVNLLRAGVDPANILAITFTRKAAAEMRERILATLRAAADRGEFTPSRWRELRDRLGDIAISTIDAFCLSLLREFPLEADLEPGFSVADETEVPRLVDESLDRALRICRGLAREDERVALVFAQLGDRRARAGLAALLNRRLVAPAALDRYIAAARSDLDLAGVARRGAAALIDVFASMSGGLVRFLETGPPVPAFRLLAGDLRRLASALERGEPIDPAAVQAAFARVREHVLTQDGTPRARLSYPKAAFACAADFGVHRRLVQDHAPAIADAYRRYRRDVNTLVSYGVWRMFRIAESEYRRTLDAHGVLDFPEILLRAIELLRKMDEFAQSRYRLESRYHHVLVDEFQDTSRAQWELISLLVQSWGEGAGLAYDGPLPPTIFIVGDRKQSIYGFRDADVSVLDEAGRYLAALRPGGDVRQSISRSFRSVPPLLSFVNDLCQDVEKTSRRDAFEYREEDRFPVDGPVAGSDDVLGLITAEAPEACAAAAADVIAHLLSAGVVVRDRGTGVRRPVRPGDIAILFRTRDGHREYEAALERRRIPAYVYKGLGFFDADEIKDVLALLWYLADPLSDLRAAAWLRSRFVRLSDEGLRRLAPRLADALAAPREPDAAAALDPSDREALRFARAASARWRGLVDRMTPAELLDLALHESAYAIELRGPRFLQARENLKKMRGIIRRIQNRGYATLGRLAAHLDRLAVGDESNASVDALDAVNLMTIHAAKGLEFPVVLLASVARGTAGRREPIRVTADPDEDSVEVAIGDFLSEADEDHAVREREETKRLLYVAVTRARDRLYLAATLKDGRVQPGRGSLAEVFPPSLLECFAAPPGQGVVAWRARSGTVHTFRVWRPGEADDTSEQAAGTSPGAEAIPVDTAPLDDPAPPRVSVAMLAGSGPVRDSAAAASDRLLGTLVHRLVQHVGLVCESTDDNLRARLAALLRPDEILDAGERSSLFARAVEMYRRISERAEIRDLYQKGAPMHEVPFVMTADGVCVRGTIDCLICHPDGRVTVLELKTGRPRPEHERQAELYRRAAARLFPGSPVDVSVVYAGETTS